MVAVTAVKLPMTQGDIDDLRDTVTEVEKEIASLNRRLDEVDVALDREEERVRGRQDFGAEVESLLWEADGRRLNGEFDGVWLLDKLREVYGMYRNRDYR